MKRLLLALMIVAFSITVTNAAPKLVSPFAAPIAIAEDEFNIITGEGVALENERLAVAAIKVEIDSDDATLKIMVRNWETEQRTLSIEVPEAERRIVAYQKKCMDGEVPK